jgi:hypothetical protein
MKVREDGPRILFGEVPCSKCHETTDAESDRTITLLGECAFVLCAACLLSYAEHPPIVTTEDASGFAEVLRRDPDEVQ